MLEFLTGCPAATATGRRRVAAIDHHHRAAGHPAPGEHDDVRAAVGRPPKDPMWVCPDRAALETVLRALPSHGFTAGLFGQRDRALLVLAQLAGLPYKAIAALTATDLRHDPNTRTVTITTSRRGYTVDPVDDPVLCPACVLARWQDLHGVMTRHIATRSLAAYLGDVQPVTDSTTHRCRRPASSPLEPVALLPPIDQWGHVPFPQTRLSPHTVSRHARDLLTGQVPIHRDLAVSALEQTPDQQSPPEIAAPPSSPYGAAQREAAWNRRRDDLRQLGTVAADLDQVERRAAELNQRVAALLAGLSDQTSG